MKTKHLIAGLGMALLGGFAQAQNGLENITVEKYYVANAADAAGSIGALPAGSVTYRVYADMLPGYNLQAVYGGPGHELKITTTTSFFNNEDYGSTTPTGISVTNTRKHTVMLDSWFSMGGNAAGKVAVLKTEDTDGALVNSTGLLQNNDPTAGNPLTTHDGMIAGTPASVTFVGLNNTGNGDLGVFDGTSQVGGSFSSFNGSIAVLGGVTGPTAANRVLIGQFTTNGVFGFELNIQIGTPAAGTQNYVAVNPTGAEITIPTLTLAPNNPPTVSITAPSNGANYVTGSVVAISANASDVDGTVTGVEFFVDAVSIGVDNTSPYTANYTSTAGSHNITAKATDDDLDFTTSSAVTINVANNQAPSVSVSAAATAVVGDIVTVTASASDVDGTVASVEFFVDNVSVGTDNTAPYTYDYTAVIGTHNFKATATDNLALSATSSTISILVSANVPPSVSLTAPTSGATYTAPQVVSMAANAADGDGSVTNVEFLVNGSVVGSDNTSPYTFDWTSVIGTANIAARATDNKGATTTSSVVSLSIADPNALPYSVVSKTQTCLPASVCIPVKANDTVNNVIGYDIVMNYDIAKLTPTGNITKGSSLINPTYIDVVNSIDAANGLINISVYLNSSAPANAEFNGVGELFCVEFTKTVNFASVDTSTIAISFLQESYIVGVSSKLAESGDYITYRDTVFNGKLRFHADNSPIKYNSGNPNDHLITNIRGTDANCANPSAVAVQPDLNGNFVYNTNNGLSINIDKDILGTTDVQPVINGADALLTRKVLLNDNSFTPNVYQIIAMDVNLDGVVSAGDVSQQNQRAVLMIPEFKQAHNYDVNGVSNGTPSKDWLFVDSLTVDTSAAYAISASFPANDGVGYSKANVPNVSFCLPLPIANYAVCPLNNPETYKGILMGDVNGNFSTVNPNSAFKLNASRDKVIFDLSKSVVENGQVSIPVSIYSNEVINALDFSFQYNEEKMTLNTVSKNADYMEALYNYNADDKTVRFTSNSFQSYEANKAVVMVTFDVVGEQQITEADLQSAVGYLNGEQVAARVIGNNTTALVNEIMVNVYPNPATNMLNIVVAENATVMLMDVEGKQVLYSANVNANDKHVISTDNIANGVYMLKVYNKNFVSNKKVLINK